MVGMVGRLGARNRHQGRASHPGRLQRRSEHRGASVDRLPLAILAILLLVARLPLQIRAQRLFSSQPLAFVAPLLNHLISLVFLVHFFPLCFTAFLLFGPPSFFFFFLPPFSHFL